MTQSQSSTNPDTDLGPFSDVTTDGSKDSGEDMSFGDTEPRTLMSRLSQGTPSRPLFGRLPLARLIPQDVHSVLDYVDAATVLSGAVISDCPKARTASALIGGSGIGLSAITDYRLSLARVVPIEAHEVVDYAFGVSAISAPFLFGYYKTAPITAAIHVATGVGTILASLFTDYRAYRGAGRHRVA
ncbi:MAG TPA: hypothetical protein VJV79_11275 [Polyangiaceae bacterium]|nr:hypothetical protein [Polyangiaceae bacterium]